MLYLERERPNLEHTRTYTQKCIHTDYEGEGGTVKKPISYWAFVGKRCVEALCIAKDAGFKRIELEMDGTGDLTPKTTPPQLAELKSAAEEIGIQCCRDLDLYWKHSFPSDDVDERKRAHATAVAQPRQGDGHGHPLLVVPGSVSVDFVPDRLMVPPQRGLRAGVGRDARPSPRE